MSLLKYIPKFSFLICSFRWYFRLSSAVSHLKWLYSSHFNGFNYSYFTSTKRTFFWTSKFTSFARFCGKFSTYLCYLQLFTCPKISTITYYNFVFQFCSYLRSYLLIFVLQSVFSNLFKNTNFSPLLTFLFFFNLC